MPAISNTMLSYNNFRELFGMDRVALYDEQAANVLVSRDPATGITLEYTGKLLRLYYSHRQPPPIPPITLLHSFPYSIDSHLSFLIILYSIQFHTTTSSYTLLHQFLTITQKELPLSFIFRLRDLANQPHRHERFHLRQASRRRPGHLPAKLPEQLHPGSKARRSRLRKTSSTIPPHPLYPEMCAYSLRASFQYPF